MLRYTRPSINLDFSVLFIFFWTKASPPFEEGREKKCDSPGEVTRAATKLPFRQVSVGNVSQLAAVYMYVRLYGEGGAAAAEWRQSGCDGRLVTSLQERKKKERKKHNMLDRPATTCQR